MVNKKAKNRLLICSIAAGALVVGYLVLCVIAGGKDFIGNTVVNGVDISEMTKQEAITAIENQYNIDNGNTLTLSVNDDKQYMINVENALSFDATQGVEDIYNKHHSSFFNQGVLLASKNEYSIPVTVVDQSVIENAIKESGILDYNTSIATTYNLLDNEIEFVKGKEGVKVNQESVVLDITNALSQYQFKDGIVCTLEKSGMATDEMTKYHTELNKEMKNATLDKSNDYAIVPSQTGVSYSLEDAITAFNNAQEGETFKVSATISKPTVTTEDLEENLFKDVLGSYTTKVSGTAVRKSNVKLAGLKCGGTILLPGEEFSYNKVVGKRTEAAGFGAAGAYVGGETVDVIGGGVCQPSSTLYNAVMLANLKITERHAHSYVSSYVPIGRDATVSWGALDFKFKNDTDYPIKVSASYSNSRLTMKIYGTNVDNTTVKITSTKLSSKPYQTIEKEDPTLEVGKKVTEVSGYNAATAQSYRHVYKDGVLVSKTKEAYSSYKRRDKVVLVGTKPKATTPTTPTTPSTPGSTTPPSTEGTGGQ